MFTLDLMGLCQYMQWPWVGAYCGPQPKSYIFFCLSYIAYLSALSKKHVGYMLMILSDSECRS